MSATRRISGTPGPTIVLAVAGVLLAAATAACRVEWGGGAIALENPAPPPDTTEAEVELEPEQVPLPEGPFLHLVRLGPDGGARVTPLARVAGLPGDASFLAVEMPPEDPSFRSRFDSAFLAPGTELELLGRGGRLGSLVVENVLPEETADCLSAVRARALVPPGQSLPDWAFAAVPGLLDPGLPRRIAPLEIARSMTIAGPVLAERLIGGDRAFLARRVAMAAVELASDTLPAMAATYLIADSLAVGPPGDDAVSLFFLARFEPAQGYIPIWEEVRRYDAAEEKEAFAYLDWVPFGEGRLDAVWRYGGEALRIALSLSTGEEGPRIDWTEPPACPASARLGP
ncbi:MAG: hypothetical protein R3266_05110 [Gemmatimonadota bacterium]|nr:hypothetical protein [Gemmatimonadota bacterium]